MTGKSALGVISGVQYVVSTTDLSLPLRLRLQPTCTNICYNLLSFQGLYKRCLGTNSSYRQTKHLFGFTTTEET